MSDFKKMVLKSLRVMLSLTIICGVIYPVCMTVVAQVLFPKQANGSIIEVDGKQYGSVLLAQEFKGDEYLWGRMMLVDTSTFTSDTGEVLMYASPSNISPASEEYEEMIKNRIELIKNAHPDQEDVAIPVDLVTVSGSGLDPHISLAAAEYQVGRIATKRGMSEDEVNRVIERYTSHKFLGFLGEDTVNVLEVNLALDGILK